jgi:hypothetical protein
MSPRIDNAHFDELPGAFRGCPGSFSPGAVRELLEITWPAAAAAHSTRGLKRTITADSGWTETIDCTLKIEAPGLASASGAPSRRALAGMI